LHRRKIQLGARENSARLAFSPALCTHAARLLAGKARTYLFCVAIEMPCHSAGKCGDKHFQFPASGFRLHAGQTGGVASGEAGKGPRRLVSPATLARWLPV
jgi:hypothetical protein